jgi:hypothetical protein
MWSDLSNPVSAPGQERLQALWGAIRSRLTGWRRRRLGLRGLLPYLLAAPLMLAALIALATAQLTAAAWAAAAFAAIVTGARLNRRVLLERHLATERRYTRPDGLLLHYAAAAMVAGGTLLAAFGVAGQGLPVSLVYGLLATIGFHLSYRLPALRELFPGPRVSVGDPALAKALAQAEERLLVIEAAGLRVGNAELEDRLRRITRKGRMILEVLSQRPTDLFRARQFLNLHLEGAARVADRYVKAHRFLRGGILEQRFRRVLVQIETAFDRQRQQLLTHDLQDLDVQIEVLRQQLRREGIA